jgi:hypothetical protein
MFIFSCERKGAKKLVIKAPSKKLKSMMESIHDPVEDSEEKYHKTEISENSFIVKSTFNVQGDLLRKEKFNERGNLEWKEVLKYDQNRNNLECVTYHFKEITKRTINKFNAPHQLIESIESNEDGKVINKETVQFATNGNQISSLYVLVKGVFTKTAERVFTKDGHNIESHYFSEEKLTISEINRYDEQGNRIETIQFDPSKNGERIINYKYDDQRNNTETVVMNSSLMIESKTIATFDAKNNVANTKVYGVTGNLRKSINYVYEYDEAGNWTRQMVFENKKLISVTLHHLEYY